MSKKFLWLFAAFIAGQINLADAALAKDAGNLTGSAWAHENSDLKPEAGVVLGRLPNGMRYAIFKNTTPPGQAAIRLRIGTGSLNESDAQQGVAHLLEHMAFKGSKRVPEGEMIKILQRKGLAFGADTNALTDWTQTVYQLDLPKADLETAGTALMLMRETVSELSLDAGALDRERKVVLSEERTRDTPGYRAEVARLGLLFEGQLASKRMPIGKTDVIEHASPGLVREFYTANYRPERAALIVTGDIDPAAIEDKIKSLFGDWTAAGAAAPEPVLGEVRSRALTAKVIEQPGTNTYASINWAKPFDKTRDSKAKRSADLVEWLTAAVLDRRLDKLARGDHPPFLSAGISIQNSLASAKLVNVSASSAPESWREALGAIDREQRRLVQYGMSQDEIDLEVAALRKTLEDQTATAATRTTTDLAQQIVWTIDNNYVFLSPADRLALYESLMTELKAERVNPMLRGVFDGAGPLVMLSSPVPVEGGDATVEAEYKKAHAIPVSPPQVEATVAWPYTDFGKPGTVAEQKEIDGLGVTAVRFNNGVRLTIKPTKFRDDEILVGVNAGNGYLDLAKDSPVWLLNAFLSGGLKKASLDDIERILASKVGSLNFSVADDAFTFGGRTNKRDLELQLQIAAAYLAEPGYRPEAVERVRIQSINALPQMEATAGGVYSRDIGGLLHNGDQRWVSASREKLEAGKAEELKAMLEGPLSNGSIEIMIIGDVVPETAIKLTAATFGALAPRAEPKLPSPARAISFPASGTLVEQTHKGRPDEALAFVAWPATDFFAEPLLPYAAYIAAEILKNRLVDQVRSLEGATYSPQAGREMSMAFPGYGYVWSVVETTPSKIDSFYENVSKITADMAANGVTADEFARARTPAIENLKKERQSNEYWFSRLRGAQGDPRRFDNLRVHLSQYEKLTPEDIKQVVIRYLTGDKAWKMAVRPGGTQASAASPVIK
jgi:zinc protease